MFCHLSLKLTMANCKHQYIVQALLDRNLRNKLNCQRTHWPVALKMTWMFPLGGISFQNSWSGVITSSISFNFILGFRDKRNFKHFQFWPESPGAMLECCYIKCGLFKIQPSFLQSSAGFHESKPRNYTKQPYVSIEMEDHTALFS